MSFFAITGASDDEDDDNDNDEDVEEESSSVVDFLFSTTLKCSKNACCFDDVSSLN